MCEKYYTLSEINNESQIVEASPSPIFLILKPLIRLLQFCLCLIDSFPIRKISLLKIERIAKQDELEAKIRRIRSLLKNEIKINSFQINAPKANHDGTP